MWRLNKLTEVDNAIIRIDSSIVIEKNIEAVWGILINVSQFSRWNPLIKHAAIYGPLVKGTRLKILAGKWDFDCYIEHVKPLKEIYMVGKSIGLGISFLFDLAPAPNGSLMKINMGIDGWIARIFKGKTENSINEFMGIFLSSLNNKVLGGESFHVKKDDDTSNNEDNSVRMPTPFNIIYKTRTRKFGKRGPNLK